MKKRSILGFAILMVVGLIFSTSLVSAYRGDMSTHGQYYTPERQETITNSINNLDYDSWYSTMTEYTTPRIVNYVTADNFGTFAELYNARLNNDYTRVQELRTELNFGQNNERNSNGRGMNQRNFVDIDGDGVCDYLE